MQVIFDYQNHWIIYGEVCFHADDFKDVMDVERIFLDECEIYGAMQ